MTKVLAKHMNKMFVICDICEEKYCLDSKPGQKNMFGSNYITASSLLKPKFLEENVP